MNRTRASSCALALLACACSKPDSERARAGAARSAPADVCGRVVFASTGADERTSIEILAAGAGPSSPVIPAGQRSLFPAAVAPDGRSLLLLSSSPQPDGRTRDQLALVDLHGLPREASEIGPTGAQLRNPAWSPDGSFIVFESDAESFRDLYRLQLGSGQLLRLTDNPEGNFEPAVSPDSQRIAFASSRDGNAEIYVMNADGGAPQRLTDSRGDDASPTWSPDGRALAFTSARERARGIDVFVLAIDGGEVRPAVREGSREGSIIANDLAWSPDGTRLAFTELTPAGGGAVIAIVDPERGEVIARTRGPGIDEQPAWSPDGAHLVFTRGHGQRSDLFRMRADASELARLTDGEGSYWLPRWVADPDCARAQPALPAPAHAGQG
ncbi:hypothetical protein ENSA5_44520 [Enhygromyxa salina]|uniref:Translocation protein TolB n=1 Tax=Enhygromyxa salina TaxID=215803 RepID=A0A2S9XJZ8_9BACT|nr:LpqB family beta-propeller domain-containing protein [Enhygromyxa salina]PRP93185.1 hypothetical protein ENSA5_44520 [Enhygromyxa salina]